MSNACISAVSGRAIYVAGDDIDTDRIIPARFLRCVTFDGLGDFAFFDERFAENGEPKGHPFDAPERQGSAVLVSGRNFGCGSSREHAPQALLRFGIRAVIAESFAEIFFGNCTGIGVICAALDRASLDALSAAVAADASLQVVVDVAQRKISAGELTLSFTLTDAVRDAFLAGEYDPLEELLARHSQVAAVHDALPYTGWSTP